MSNTLVKQLVLVAQSAIKRQYSVKKVALFDSNGDPLVINEGLASTVLEGYEIAAEEAAVAGTDTISEAIGKLEKGLDNRLTANLVIDGYVTDDTPTSLADTDTVNEALGKLEGFVEELQTGLEGLDVLGTVLEGFVTGDPINVTNTDTVLEAFQKVQGLIFNLISRVELLEAEVFPGD